MLCLVVVDTVSDRSRSVTTPLARLEHDLESWNVVLKTCKIELRWKYSCVLRLNNLKIKRLFLGEDDSENGHSAESTHHSDDDDEKMGLEPLGIFRAKRNRNKKELKVHKMAMTEICSISIGDLRADRETETFWGISSGYTVWRWCQVLGVGVETMQ